MKLTKIKDFAKVITGGTPSTNIKEYWENGNIPWLNSGELNKGIIKSSENYITKLGLENSVTKLMPPNTVLIALTGATTGVTALLKIEACANQSVTGILPSNKHNSEYLFYFLSSIREKILKRSWGGAQKHINQEYVKNINVPFPSLSEQKQIAETLKKVDNLRQKRKQSIQLLDDYIKSVFYDMFGDPVKNNKKWKTESLGNVLKEKNSIKCGPFGSQLKINEYVKEGIPVYGIDNVEVNRFIESKPKFITKEKYKELKSFKVDPGDLLITRTGTVGRVCLAPSKVKESVIGPNLLLIKCNLLFLIPEYLSFCFNNCDPIIKQIKLFSPGATVAVYNTTNLKKLKILLPPILLQKKFTEIYKRIELLKFNMEESLKEIENLFNALMQKYFSNN